MSKKAILGFCEVYQFQSRGFYLVDQWALVTLQLTVFCDTAYHAAFAIKTSIKPICCLYASLFLGFFESLSVDQETV